jgi:hypothetical protein
MGTNPCISLDTNLVNLGIMLQLTTSRPPVGLQSVSIGDFVDLLSVDLLDLLSITLTLTFLLTYLLVDFPLLKFHSMLIHLD